MKWKSIHMNVHVNMRAANFSNKNLDFCSRHLPSSPIVIKRIKNNIRNCYHQILEIKIVVGQIKLTCIIYFRSFNWVQENDNLEKLKYFLQLYSGLSLCLLLLSFMVFRKHPQLVILFSQKQIIFSRSSDTDFFLMTSNLQKDKINKRFVYQESDVENLWKYKRIMWADCLRKMTPELDDPQRLYSTAPQKLASLSKVSTK